ncbi:MAG: M20 family metallopeptidase [Vibrio sp.]|uniref:M20 family metallopeptidase n=1 Tax=Vibrio sp. TaxID=678 RepID=UPI003A89C211
MLDYDVLKFIGLDQQITLMSKGDMMINSEFKNKPIFALDLQSYLADLEYLVNIDSGSYDREGVQAVSAFFIEQFSQLGWRANLVEVDDKLAPCVEIFSPSCGKEIDNLLLGHLDTVFPKGTVAQRPFHIEAQRAYGPGVADMKSGALYCLYLARAYYAAGITPPAICVALNSHEEIGSRQARPWLEDLARRARRTLVIEPGRANGDMVIARRGSCRYTLLFTGKAAHSGVDPQNGASAVNEAAHWTIELHKLTDYAQEFNLNVGILEGGVSVNAVADSARIELDVRFSAMEQADIVQKRLDEMQAAPFTVGVSVEVIGGVTRPPMSPSEESLELARFVDQVAEELGVKIGWQHTGGGSDGNFTAALGIPTLDGMGPIGGRAHSREEYLEINSIESRFTLLAAVIDQL